MRSFDRGPLDHRPLTITPGVSRHAEGSAELRIGHTWVRDTYWYLSACPDLMQEAARRLDRRWEAKP